MNQSRYKKPRPKKPVDVFTKCLGCDSRELIHIEPDVQCCKCDWNSFEVHVHVGGFDCHNLKLLPKHVNLPESEIETEKHDPSKVVA